MLQLEKNLDSKKLGDCGDLLSDGGELISDGDDLLADGGNLLGDGCDLLGDGGDLLGNGGDLLGDGGHHNVISTLCKGSEAVTEWKTRKKVMEHNGYPAEHNGYPAEHNGYPGLSGVGARDTCMSKNLNIPYSVFVYFINCLAKKFH